MKKLKAGFGRADITPELGVRLGGYAKKERPAEQILDPLHSTAMFLQQNEQAAAVINLDWVSVEEKTVARIRQQVHQAVNIPESHITVCATHTHSSPNTLDSWGWGGPEKEYIDGALPKIVRSVEEARKNQKKTMVGFAATESLVGVNRRGITEDGGLSFRAYPQGPFDPNMTVMYFKDEAGDIGILVHYGCHGTAMGNNRIVSRDWCGVMKDRIESQFDGPVVYLNGASGNVGPRTNRRRGSGLSAGGGDGIHAVREVGYRAATDAIRALLSIKEWRDDVNLQILNEPVFLPYAPLPPLETAKTAKEELSKSESQEEKFGAAMRRYQYYKAVVEAHGQPQQDGRDFHQTITAIGPLALVPMPGEIFAGISLRMRENSPCQYTLCCGMSNGSLSYFPSQEALHRGGYEIKHGRTSAAYCFAENIDDVLVGENLKLLRKLVNPQ